MSSPDLFRILSYMKKYSIDDIEQLLHENDLKITPIRVFLLEILISSTTPLTTAEIAKMAKKSKASLSTIYRALHDFVEMRLVDRHILQGETVSYTFHTKTHKHYIVCNKCAAIEPIAFCMRSIHTNAALKSKLFKKISGHALSFVGTCRKCTRSVR